MISNYISFFHALSCTIVSYILKNTGSNISKKILLSISTSYFTWDTCNIIVQKQYKNIPYIYHHLVCLYMLYKLNSQNNQDDKLIIDIFFIGELSNLFNYIVYYAIKKKYPSNVLKKIKMIQFMWFGYFRFYYMSNMIYNYFIDIQDNILSYNLMNIYLMGIYWGVNQFKGLLLNH